MAEASKPTVPHTGDEIRTRIPGTPTDSDVDTDVEEPLTHTGVDLLDDSTSGNEDMEARLAANKVFLEQELSGALELGHSRYKSTRVGIQTMDRTTKGGLKIVTILKPTASKFTHEILHPRVYRELEPVGSLNDLAVLLKAPPNWESICDTKILNDAQIMEKLEAFTNLPVDKKEDDIEQAFSALVYLTLYKLKISCLGERATRVYVGGILAHNQYDIKSKPNVQFRLQGSNTVLLATKVKSHPKFPDDQYWYCGSRGIQVLSSLYAFNCPTFLFSQNKWKLFVENEARNQILTLPYGSEPSQTNSQNSSSYNEMGTGTNFLQAVVICLLSGRKRSELPVDYDPIVVSPVASSSRQHEQMKSPQKTKQTQRSSGGEPEPRRRSKRIRASQDESLAIKAAAPSPSAPPIPSFVSDYVDGKPIYTLVRVWTREEVQEKEAEIALV